MVLKFRSFCWVFLFIKWGRRVFSFLGVGVLNGRSFCSIRSVVAERTLEFLLSFVVVGVRVLKGFFDFRLLLNFLLILVVFGFFGIGGSFG